MQALETLKVQALETLKVQTLETLKVQALETVKNQQLTAPMPVAAVVAPVLLRVENTTKNGALTARFGPSTARR